MLIKQLILLFHSFETSSIKALHAYVTFTALQKLLYKFKYSFFAENVELKYRKTAGYFYKMYHFANFTRRLYCENLC